MSRRPRGFSLLELVVVIVVIGILSLIAVTSFGWVSAKGDATAAQSVVERVSVVEISIAREHGVYSSWPADVTNIGHDVTALNGGPSTAPNEASVAAGSDGSLGIALFDGKTCLYRRLAAVSAGATVSTPTVTGGTCSGADSLPEGVQVTQQTQSVTEVTY